MCIKISEMMHGAVLARISKNDPSVTLTMIETSDESRNMYRINDDLMIYTKFSNTPDKSGRGKSENRKWQFKFTIDNLIELRDRLNSTSVYVVLVCTDKDFKNGEFCLIKSDEIQAFVDFSTLTKEQTIFVEVRRGQKLRVFPSKKIHPIKIARNALDNWKIPGR